MTIDLSKVQTNAEAMVTGDIVVCAHSEWQIQKNYFFARVTAVWRNSNGKVHFTAGGQNTDASDGQLYTEDGHRTGGFRVLFGSEAREALRYLERQEAEKLLLSAVKQLSPNELKILAKKLSS